MIKDTDVLPSQRKATFLADYLELRALLNIDECFTKSEFISIVGGQRGHASILWRDAFNTALSRANQYGDRYPFEIPSDESDVVVLRTELSNLQEAYVSLLICSCLKYFERKNANHLAREFEKFSKDVFGCLLPTGSVIKGSWANPDEEDDCYTGHLADKLIAIATDIRCNTTDAINRDHFNDRDFGDGGIDLVGWHNMHDERPGIPVAMGQCGCSVTEWKFKQIECSPARYQGYMPLIHPWSTFYFCPLDLSKSETQWHFQSDIGGAIIIDRIRFINILENNEIVAPKRLSNLDRILEIQL